MPFRDWREWVKEIQIKQAEINFKLQSKIPLKLNDSKLAQLISYGACV